MKAERNLEGRDKILSLKRNGALRVQQGIPALLPKRARAGSACPDVFTKVLPVTAAALVEDILGSHFSGTADLVSLE